MMTLMAHIPAKRLTTAPERLQYVNIDYNHAEHAPDLTSLRHKAFMPGAGTTYTPQVVFLLKSPCALDTRAGETKRGVQYRMIEDLCKQAGIRDYYVTYLMKYEMHGDRDPRTLERNIALAYVREELSILDPQVVALVGEGIHRLVLPDAPWAPWAHKILKGRRSDYYALHDLLPARRSARAYADLQDEFTHMADIIARTR